MNINQPRRAGAYRVADRQATTMPMPVRYMAPRRQAKGFSGPGTASAAVGLSILSPLAGIAYIGYKLFEGSGWGPQSDGMQPATVVTNDLSMGQGGPGGPYTNVSTGVDPTSTKIPVTPDVNQSSIPGWVAPVGVGVLLLALSGGAAALLLKKKKGSGKIGV